MKAGLHKKSEPCPEWCHLCPHVGGMVFPHCFGSVVSHFDEYDLQACTCDPGDPLTTHLALVAGTHQLITFLRDARRQRGIRKLNVQRLFKLAALMETTGSVQGHINAWGQVRSIANSLREEILDPAKVADAAENSVRHFGARRIYEIQKVGSGTQASSSGGVVRAGALSAEDNSQIDSDPSTKEDA